VALVQLGLDPLGPCGYLGDSNSGWVDAFAWAPSPGPDLWPAAAAADAGLGPARRRGLTSLKRFSGRDLPRCTDSLRSTSVPKSLPMGRISASSPRIVEGASVLGQTHPEPPEHGLPRMVPLPHGSGFVILALCLLALCDFLAGFDLGVGIFVSLPQRVRPSAALLMTQASAMSGDAQRKPGGADGRCLFWALVRMAYPGHHPQGALWAPLLDDPGSDLRAVAFEFPQELQSISVPESSMFLHRQLVRRLSGHCLLAPFSRHPTDAAATSRLPSGSAVNPKQPAGGYYAHPGYVLIGYPTLPWILKNSVNCSGSTFATARLAAATPPLGGHCWITVTAPFVSVVATRTTVRSLLFCPFLWCASRWHCLDRAADSAALADGAGDMAICLYRSVVCR